MPARTLIKAQGRHVRGRLGFLFYPGFCRGAWLRTLRWRRCHLLQNFEADPSLGLCEIVIKHLLGVRSGVQLDSYSSGRSQLLSVVGRKLSSDWFAAFVRQSLIIYICHC